MFGKKWCWPAAFGAVLSLAGHASADELEARSNPVANGSIVIDGDLTDWAGVAPFSPDPTGDAVDKQDWRQVWMAHDDMYLYFRLERAAGSVGFDAAGGGGAPLGGQGYRIILDTDENPATGLAVVSGLNLAVGGEFGTNGVGLVSRYGAGGDTCGLGWFPLASAWTGNAGAMFEGSIPRSALGDPTDFDFTLRGLVDADPASTQSDYYPDGSIPQPAGTEYFHYTTGVPIAPGSRPPGMLESLSNPVTITIDGDFSDWAGVTPYTSDPTPDGNGRDWVSISIAHDDTNFYFRGQRAPGSLTFLDYPETWYWIMFDTDRNAGTGSTVWSSIGVEYWTTGIVNSWGLAWSAVALDPGPVSIEAAVRRADIGDPAAMNLVFAGVDQPDLYPDGAATGDYYHYTVHAPTPVGGEPIEVATLSNRVANGAIAIDGDFSDWATVPSYPADTAGDGGGLQDWVRGSIAHDDANVYFLLERAPQSVPFSAAQGQGYWVVMDTDRNVTTGFTGFGTQSFSIGGEYNLSGSRAAYAWDVLGCYDHSLPMTVGIPPTEAEFAVARTSLGDPTDFNFVCLGENSGDRYPDTSLTEVFHYTTGSPLDPLPAGVRASISNAVPDGQMHMDGDLSDWVGVTPFPVDAVGDGGTTQDWVQVWLAHDSVNFYVRMKRGPGSAGFATPGYWIGFDTDRNTATGLANFFGAVGAEFNSGGIVALNGWDAGGGYTGPVSFAGTAEGNESVLMEASIARADLGLTSPMSRFRVVYASENSGDQYPERSNADTTFLYVFVPCNTPFADADGDSDVDQNDFGTFQRCFGGSGIPVVAGCECFDRDFGDQGNGYVDVSDLIKFLNCFGGPTVPPPSTCGQ